MRTTSALFLVLLFAAGCAIRASEPVGDRCDQLGEPKRLMQVQVDGAGRPVVFLGGGILGALNWQQHAQRLATDRRVLRLQNLNVQYGLENRPLPTGYSVRMESCALQATLDSLGLEGPIDLVGLSLGALTSLDFALNHPARIRTLTLVEPPGAWVLDAPDRQSAEVRAWERVMVALRKPEVSERDLIDFTCAVQGCPGGMTLEQATRVPGWETRLRHRQSLRGVYAVAAHQDDVARLRSFDRPVLFVEGEGTGPVHVRINTAFRRHLPHARYLALPGGHSAAQLSMERFLTELVSFLTVSG